MTDDHRHLHEAPLDSTQVFRGKLLDVRLDRVQLPDGAESVREYVVHPGAVVIIAEQDNGELLFERQYRYPLRRAFLELPAGKIDPGEDILRTAVRELLEETGHSAAEWRSSSVSNRTPSLASRPMRSSRRAVTEIAGPSSRMATALAFSAKGAAWAGSIASEEGSQGVAVARRRSARLSASSAPIASSVRSVSGFGSTLSVSSVRSAKVPYEPQTSFDTS